MSIADILSGIGTGAAKVGRVAGAVLEPLGMSLADTLSGEGPEKRKEQRAEATKLSDEAREARANELESQLEMGRKYGTLTPDQQKQYVDEITKLYSHPSQMGSLMKRLQKAIHPQGAVYLPPSSLKDATPAGGTAAADVKLQEGTEARKLADEMALIDRRAADQAANEQALNEYRAAMLDLRQKQEELAAAKFAAEQDPNNPQARQKAIEAQARLTQAQAYALRAQGAYLGTYGGKPLPGAALTAEGQPVGSAFAPNVRPMTTEIGRADLATSALEQIGDLEKILKTRGDLFGPGAGRATQLSQWLGSQDPDAQRFTAAVTTAADHLMGVFGGRSSATGQRIEAAMGQFKTNPEAALAALEQFAKAAKTIQARGTRHVVGGVPGTTAAPVTPGQILPKTGVTPLVQFSPSTKQYRYSLDGGATWQPGQPPQ